MSSAHVVVKKINSDHLLAYVHEEVGKRYEERKGLLTEQICQLNRKSAFGAYIGRELVGFAVLVDGTGHLDALHVSRDNRKKRVATTLIEELNITGVMVENDNHVAKALYEKLEFYPVSKLGDVAHYERDLL